MSEYQYYEFVSIDRLLTTKQMDELRSRSSRATITVTSFVNEYHFGDLKGDPSDWLQRYFDAFVYVANWRSCRLAFRIPCDALEDFELSQYASGGALSIDRMKTHWIIEWSLDEGGNDERFNMEDGRGWMGRLAPLREELLRGDLRPLYLGWLASVTAGEVDDDDHEPEVPQGMAKLSAAQQALVEFLEIDTNLLAAAALGSAEVEEWVDDDSLEVWVTELSKNEIRRILNLLLLGASQQAERQVKSAFFEWQRESQQIEVSPKRQRKVSELRTLAEASERDRLAHQEKERVRQKADQLKKREAYLKTLAADFDRHWSTLHQVTERGTASGYDAAAHAIVDLSDAYALVSSKAVFDSALRNFMARHGKRTALTRRLVETGLWKK